MLTTGVDISGNLVGSAGTTNTAGNDTFLADNTGANVTSVADTLNGGTGTDTFKIYGYTAGTDSMSNFSNIENVVLDNSADVAATAVSFANKTGITSVTVQNAVGETETTVADGVTVTLKANADNSKDQTVNYSATQTSANLVLDGATGTTGVKTEAFGAAVTTLNLSTTGTASSIGELNVDTLMATVVITGDKNLTIVDAVEDAVNTINASAFTGNLSVKVADAIDAGAVNGVDTADITVNTGSGADTVDLTLQTATNEVAVNTGAGNDTVKVATAATYTAPSSTTAGDVINGGEGTDTLSVNGNLAASDMSASITGFEVLEFTADAGGTNMSVNKTGINQFVMGDAIDVTLTGLSANATVTMSGAGTGPDASTLSATIGTDTTADVLNVNLESTGATTGSEITAVNYDTLNLVSTKASTDAATVANTLADITATAASALNISGTQALTITTAALKANAAVTSTSTGNVTSTFTTALASYTGSTGNDVLSLAAGNLAQGKTFAGGTGTDSLTVAASASQDMGIVGLTGFETLNLTTSGANVGDFRNVTDLATISVTAGAGTDDLTLNRLSADTTLAFTGSINQVVTTLNAGTSQKVAFTAAATVTNITLDSGTTALTVTSSNGDGTADEAMGVFTDIDGTSLASITVLGEDRTDLGTLKTTVTSVNASAATGGLTVIASATATTIVGSQVADAITGGGAADTIQGGKGADVLDGGAGADVFVFEATGANNGADVFSVGGANKLVAGAGGDVLNFKNFLSGGSVDQNGGTGTAITAYLDTATSDVNITNKVVLLAATNGTTDDNVDTAAKVAALIQGAGNVFSLTSGGKAIVVAGDTASDAAVATDELLFVYFVDDSLDGVAGTVGAADVVLVGTTTQDFDLDTLITTNFAFA